MNNVFRLIWNRTLGRLVVASEAARSRDKAATRQGVVGQLPAPEAVSSIPALLRPAVIAVALAAGSMMLVAPERAAAAAYAGGSTCNTNDNDRIAIGEDAKACYDFAVAIGSNAEADGINAIAIGFNSYSRTVDYGVGFVPHSSLAMGNSAYADGDQTVALGSRARAVLSQSTAIGNDTSALGSGSIVIGGDDLKTYSADGLTLSNNDMSNFLIDKGWNYQGVDDAIDPLAAGGGGNIGYLKSQARGTGSTVVGVSSIAYEIGSTVVGGASLAQGEYSTAIGTMNHAEGNNSLAAGKGAHSQGDSSVAVGSSATAEMPNAVAIGAGALATFDSDIDPTDPDTYRLIDTFTNTAYTSRAQEFQNNNGGDSRVPYGVAIGDQAKTAAGISIGSDAESVKRGIALGHLAYGDDGAIALGNAARTEGVGGLAVGWEANAMGSGANAVGRVSVADGEASLAFGNSATAKGEQAIAIGGATADPVGAFYQNDQTLRTQAEGARAIALGSRAQSLNDDAIAQGTEAKASGEASIAMGRQSEAHGVRSMALGQDAKVGTFDAGGNVTGSADSAIALGDSAAATKGNASAVGVRAQATGLNASAFGVDAEASGANAIALGYEAAASDESSVAAGTKAQAQTKYSVSIGYKSNVSDSNPAGESSGGVAIGEEATAKIGAAVAIGQFAYAESGIDAGDSRPLNATAVGFGTRAVGADASSFGNRAKAEADYATALGNYANASKRNAIAAGNSAEASGVGASAFGNFAKASGVNATALGGGGEPGTFQGAQATEDGAVAIGGNSVSGAQASAIDAIAVGGESVASADYAIAMGTRAQATGNDAIAIGKDAWAAGSQAFGTNARGANGGSAFGDGAQATWRTDNKATVAPEVFADAGAAFGENALANRSGATALGASSEVLVDDGVALGSGSVTSTDAGTTTVVYGYDVSTDATADPTSAIGLTQSTKGAVSVGGNGELRQITNLAAGAQDTDAVNVAQLKAVRDIADAGSSWQVKVNDIAADTVNPDDTVQFVDGKNIKVTRNNDKVIGIATKDQVEFTQVTIGDATNNTVITSSANGLDVGGDKITSVADGEVSSTSTDAVNGSQLFATNTNVTNNTTEIAKGINFGDGATANNYALGDTINVKGDANVTSTTTTDGVQLGLADVVTVGDTSDATQNPVTIDGNTGTIGGLTNKTFDPNATYTGGQAATQEQLGGLKNYVDGETVRYYSVNSTDTGTDSNFNNDGATGSNALAAGPNAVADGDSSVAVGDNAQTGANANNQVAVGNTAQAAGDGSIAIGNGATASTIGGLTTDPGGQKTVAIGDSASAQGDNNVALGAGSVADGTTLTTAAYVPAGATSVVADSAASEVSVGSSGSERRITNVAAGGNDTDAVNVSQLKAVSGVVEQGFNITADNTNLATAADNVKLGETVDYTSADGNIVTTVDDNEIDFGLANSIDVGSTNTVTIDGNTGTIGGLTNITYDPDATYTGGQAATQEQLSGLSTDLTQKGLTFTGNVNTAGDVQRDLGETLAIQGTATAGGTYTGANLRTETDPTSGAINLQMTDSPDFANVNVSNNLDVDGTTTLGDNFTVVGDQVTYNVAPGDITNGTQVVNKDYVDGKETHFYSVNNTDPTTGNYNNDGATGTNALAAGTNALASGPSATAVGDQADAQSESGVAIGNQAIARAFGPGQVAIGFKADTLGQGDIAIGQNTKSQGRNNVALGNGATVVDSSSAFAVVLSGVALGDGATVDYTNAVALGAGSEVDEASLSTAAYVPAGATSVAADSATSEVSVGSSGAERRITNVAAGGNDTDAVNVSQLKALSGIVDQGFNITADNTNLATAADSVKLGETVDYTSADGNIVTTVDDNEIDFGLANSISVGTSNPVTIDGNTGTIGGLTNITYDPDATYTGGQAATQEQLSGLSTDLTQKGLTFTGNDNTAGDVQRDLGETLAIQGTATAGGNYTGANLRTETDPANGAINLQMTDSPEFTQVTIGDATDPATSTVLTNVGDALDVGGDQITNVESGLTGTTLETATGDDLTNAVNVGDLKNANNGLIDTGFNITADNTNLATAADNVKLGETVDYTSADGNIVTTVDDNEIDFGLANSIDVGSTNTVTIDGNTGTIGGLTNITYDPDATYTGGQAATQEQLSGLSTDLTQKGLTFTGNDNTAGDVQRDLGETLAIQGTATSGGTYTGANLRTETNPANGAINLQMTDSPEFTQVTIGDATDPATSTVLTNVGDALDVGGDQITNVESGLTGTTLETATGDDLTNAVNVGDLKNANNGLIDTGFNITADNTDLADPAATDDNVKLGETVDYTSADGNIVTTVADNEIDFGLASSIDVGSANTVTIDGDAGTVSGLTNTTYDPDATYTGGQAATQEQLSGLSTDLTQKGLTFTGNVNTAGDVQRDLGETLAIQGTATSGGTYTGANLRTETNPANGAINLQMTDSPDFTDVNVSNNLDVDGTTTLGDNFTVVGDQVTYNVAPGDITNGTQVVNKDYVDGKETHFYSVNNTDPTTGNYNNDGATGTNALAAGTNALASGSSATAVGDGSTAAGLDATAIGSGAEVTAAGTSGVAIGENAFADDENTLALGSSSKATGPQTTAIGTFVEADQWRATAVGTENTATGGVQATAVGAQNTADGTRALAVGARNDVVGGSSTAVGADNDLSGGDGSSVLGLDNKTVGGRLAAFGADNELSGGRSTALGDVNTVDGTMSIAAGRKNTVTGNFSVALGRENEVTDNSSTALGDKNEISGSRSTALGVGNTVSGIRTVALGNDNTVAGNTSQALGRDNTVEANLAGAFGYNNTLAASATGSRIIGNDNDLDVADAFVMGNDADVVVESGVAIGSDSYASTGSGIQGYNPLTGLADGTDQAIADTVSTTGAVAVGDAGRDVYRQITGVAAGTADSDAVNVSQLKAISSFVDEGFNITADNTNLGTADDNVKLGETVDYTSADGNIVTTVDDNEIDFGLANSISVGTSNPVTIDGNTGTIGGLTNKTFDPNNFTSGQAASEDQLKSVSDVANTGWDVQVNTDAADNVAPGETVQFIDGKNIAITRNADQVIEVATEDDVEFTKITVGDPTDSTTSTVITNVGDALDVGGDQITNVESGLGGQELGDVTGGDLTNAVNVGDLQNANNDLIDTGFNITADNTNLGTADDNVKLGETVDYTSADGNIVTTVADNEIDFGLGNDLTIGEDGEPGTITIVGQDGVNGTDGISLNGADGTIGLTGPAGPNGTNGLTTISIQDGVPGVNGVDGETRIVYTDPEGNDQEVATLDDGLKFSGNDNPADGFVTRKLNEEMQIVGDATNTDTAAYTSENVKTVATQDGGIEIQFADTPNFQGADMGDKQITSVESGLTGTTLETATGDDLTNAVNVGDLQNANNDLIDTGFNITADNTDLADPAATDDNVKLGETVDYTSADGNIVTTVADNEIDFGLGNDLTIGEDGEPGTITIVGQDGVNGTDGISLNGADGTIGLTGPAGPNGTNGLTTISIQDGVPGVNGVDGETRIVYTDPEGNDQEVATLDDGLKFSGNDNPADGFVTRKLNEEMQIVGDATNTDTAAYTSENVKTVATQDGGIEIQFADTPNFQGADMGDKQITSVESGLTGTTLETATGDDLTNAVNVGDLQNANNDLIDTGFNITADNTDLADPAATDDNVKLGETVDYTSADGNIVTTVADNEIDFGLGNDLTIGEDGEPGTITIVGQDGVNGTDGISLNGADGTIGLTGPAGPNGTNGLTTISIQDGVPGVNGVDGETRIVYTDPEGNDQEVATLDDGLKFSGNDNPADGFVTRKLNEEMQIVGDATNTDTAAYTSENVKTVATQDGGIEIQFADTPNFQGADMGDKQITSVESGLTGTTLETATGDDLTNAVNVGDLQNANNDLIDTGFNITADNTDLADPAATDDNVKLGETVDYTSADGNIVTTVADNEIDFGLGNDLTIGEDGEPGTITIVGQDGVNGTDGISLNGADGTIGLTGPAGPNGTNGLTTISIQDGVPGVNGVDGETRIVYTDPEGNDQEVATLDDGLKFSGNDNPADGFVTRKLNEEMQIVGDATNTDTAAYTSENVKTVATQDGGIEIQFADTPNFQGADMGDKQITSVESGLTGTTLETATGDDLTNAVNVGDLQNANNDLIDTGFNITADNTDLADPAATDDNVKLGETVDYTSADGNIVTTVADNEIDFGLGNDLTIGEDGEPGTITIVGQDGVNGTDGISLNGADGTIGLTGPAGPNGTNGLTTISIQDGVPGVNGVDGETRIVYTDPEGNDQEVATLDDGLKFSGNDNPADGFVTRKLNEEMQIVGDATNTDTAAYTSENVKTVATQDGGIEIQFADTPNFQGADMGDKQITSVESGLTGTTLETATGDDLTNAVNVGDLQNANNDLIDTGFNITADNTDLADPAATDDNVKLGETVDYTSADGNIVTTVADNEIDFGLGNDLTIGEDGEPGTITIVGQDGVNGTDGISLNGADGTIGLTGPAGPNGTNGLTTISIQDGVPGVNGVDGETRIVYTDPEGNDQEVATLDDGLKFSGNDNPADGFVTRKLNEEMQIVGDATNTDTAAYTSENVKTVATQDGGIEIQFADTPNFQGADMGDKQITSVESGLTGTTLETATGDDLTNAVNVGDLQNANNDLIDTGFNITADNTDLADPAATDDNVKLGETVDYTSADGNIVTTVADNEIDFGLGNDLTIGEDGEPGTITIVGQDGVNGTDGISLNGADGTIGLTGPAGPNGTNGLTTISIQDGVPGVNGVDGETRIVYTDPEGNDQEVATLDDGLKFSGNDNPADGFVTRKLNEEMQIVGDATNTDTAAYTSENVKTVATQDGGIEIQFADTPNFQGADMGDKQITSVESGLTGTTLETATGDDLTNAVNVGDLQSVNNDLIDTGFNIAADNGTADNVKLGETVTYTSEDGNVITTVSDNAIDFGLGNDLTIGGPGKDGQDGQDGYIGVDGADGETGVAIDGADGSIGLTGPAGQDGISPELVMSPQIVPGDVFNDDNDVTRLSYVDGDGEIKNIATLEDDGLRFSGNDNTATADGYVTRNLNEEMQIVGGATDTDTASYSSSNVTTVATQDGGIEIQFADTPNFQGADMGDKQITSVESGLTGTTLETATGDDLTNAVNVGDLQNANNDLIDTGFNITADNTDLADPAATDDNVKLGETVDYTSADGNIVTTVADNEIDFGLGNDLTIGEDGEPGTITIVGQDGVNGTDGISLNGADGTIGLTGPAGPNGTNGLTTISIQDGVPGVNGVDGETRIVYTDPEGNDQEVATLDDGLRFSGNDNTATADGYVTRNLNEEMQIVGDATNTDTAAYTSENVKTVATQDGGIEIQFADTPNFQGADMGDKQITSVESGLTGTTLETATGDDLTNAVNVGDLQNANNDLINTGFNIAADNGTADNVKLGETVTYTSEDGNVITTVSDNEIDFALNDDLTVGGPGKDGQDGQDGYIGVDGADGETGVAIDGADGSIGLTGPAGQDGISPELVMSPQIVPGDVFNDDNDVTRLSYVDGDGEIKNIATLEDDGLRFSGNDNTATADGYVTRNLNEEMQIVGGATDTDTASYSSSNVTTVATQDGGIEIQFADTPNFQGADMGGEQITGVGSGLGGQELGDVTGDDLNNAVNVGDLQDVSTAENGGGFGLADTGGATVTQDLGETIKVTDPDGNIITTADDVNGELQLSLSDDLTVGGKDGKDGTIGVDGADGVSGVVINGKDGTIGLTGPAGENGTIGIKGADGSDGINGETITRLVVDDVEVATMEDGLKFAGNKGENIAKKLGDTLNIEGQLANDEAASGANLRVDSEDGKLNLVMAKDLTDLDSITINNGGPVIDKDGIDMGGDQITNLGSGKTDANGDAVTDIADANPDNAANIGDLQDVSDVANAGWDVATSDTTGTTTSNVGPNGEVDFVSADDSITVEHTRDDATGNTSIDFALGNDLTVGEVGPAGEDGYIGVDGKDGVSGVAINGKDGTIGLTGPSGKNGTIGINGTDGSPGINGTDGITRIVYEDGEGNDYEVATMEDGLKFAGNKGENIAKKLGDTLNIEGQLANDEAASGANLRVDSEDGKLNLVMAKDLTDLDSITINDGPTINNDGIDMGGLDANGEPTNKITNLAPGESGTDAVNKNQLDSIGSIANAGWNVQTTDDADAPALSNVAPNKNVDFVSSDGNVAITHTQNDGDTDVDYRLAANINLGDEGSVQMGDTIVNNDGLTIAEGPSITEEGIDAGGDKITNVAEGEVSEDSKDAINGSQLYQVINSGDFDTRYVNTNDDGLEEKDSFANGTGSTAVGYEATSDGDQSLALGYQAMATLQGSVALGQDAVTTELGGYDDASFVYTLGAGETSKDYSFAGLDPVSTVSVGSAGNERTITNVAAGRITADSTDAINGSQLYAAMDFMNDLDGRLTIIEGDESDETAGGTLPGDGMDGVVKYDRDGGEIDYTNVTLEGKDGTTITNVADGDIADDSSDAINGSQLYDTNQDVANNTSNITDNSQRITNNEGNIADNSQRITNNEGDIADNSQRITTNENDIGDINETLDKGLNFGADEGEVVNRQLGDTVAITGDDNITTKTTDDGVQVTLDRDLDVDSVTTGGTTINDNGLTIEDGPSVTRDGIDAGGQVITNVAPGVEAGDAVNVGQMNELGQRFQNEINNVNNRIDGVEKNANAGSASAIAASSVPQAWRSGESMVSVGAGTYGGESAVAVGVSRLSDNGRWIIQGKVTGDSQGNFGAGVGAGWHW